MLTIRFQRVGRKNQAAYRIVLAEKHRAVKKKSVEILGHYNPRTKEFGLKDRQRLSYWLGQNVEVSPTVHNLLVGQNIIDAKKVKAWKPKRRVSEKEATGPEPNQPSAGEGGNQAGAADETKPADLDKTEPAKK